MSPFHILLLVFLLVPLIEIYLLIEVGGIIGALPTVFMVVFTAVLGAILVRAQGIQTVTRVQNALARGEVPATPMLEGAMLLVAGALLLTPGFFTDTIGFLCLVPSLRERVAGWLLARFLRPPMEPRGGVKRGPRTIEGEFRRED